MLTSTDFTQKLLAWVIDEAHLVTKWGDKFRPIYLELAVLRSLGNSSAPFLACTATITIDGLNSMRNLLSIDPTRCFHLNLGNNRPNITYGVRVMTGKKDTERELLFVLPQVSLSPKLHGPSLVFFDSIKESMLAYRNLVSYLPEELHNQVTIMNANRSPEDKRLVLQRLARGEIWVALCTDAVGMVGELFLTKRRRIKVNPGL